MPNPQQLDIKVSDFIDIANENSRPDDHIEFYVQDGDGNVHYAELDRIGVFGVIPDLTVTVKLPTDIVKQQAAHTVAVLEKLADRFYDEGYDRVQEFITNAIAAEKGASNV